MMDDHLTLSAARNALCSALKTLLNAGIMDAGDFRESRGHAMDAIGYLDVLLRQQDRNEAQP